MVGILNIINSISESDVVFYILVIILVIVCIAMVYLIYSQNKEMANELKRRKLEEDLNFEDDEPEEDSKMVFPVETDEDSNDEDKLDIIKADEEFDDESLNNTINDILGVDEKKEEPVYEEELPEEEEEVIETVDEEPETEEEKRKIELLDATMTDIPKQSILEETQTAIPGLLETVNEDDILQELTKDLAAGPIERNVKLTPYEEEQEKEAIISYDELINNKDNSGIVYNKEINNNNVSYKQVDLEKTAKIDTNEINKRMVEEKEVKTNTNYDYEENFLRNLKKLQKEVNG